MIGASSFSGAVAALALVLTTAGTAACGGVEGTPVGEDATLGPIATSPASTARVPGDIIDLSDWYLTLPTGRKGSPDTIYNPDLATYSGSDFQLNDTRDGVVFTADAGGVTTKGSSYPRSELREMAGPDKDDKADWSDTSGTHVMRVRQAVTELPQVKPHVVTAQIHDADDDVMEIRLEGARLLAQYDDGGKDVTIDPDYVLGTPYDLTITAADGRIAVDYDGVRKVDVPVSGSGWYFKSGCYVQSNPGKGEDPAATAQVVVYRLSVQHNP